MHGRIAAGLLAGILLSFLCAPGAARANRIPAREVEPGLYHTGVIFCCDIYFLARAFSTKGASNQTNAACIKRGSDGQWFRGRALLTGSKRDTVVMLTFQYPDENPFDLSGAFNQRAGGQIYFRGGVIPYGFGRIGPGVLPGECG